jgi:DNA modification methylase
MRVSSKKRNRAAPAGESRGRKQRKPRQHQIARHHLAGIEYTPVNQIACYQNNARVHSKRQLEKLEKVIRDLGFLVPVLIDRTGQIVAGHARIDIAKRLGMPEVPAIRLDHLTPAQVRAFRVFDNRIVEDGEWDWDKLAIEFRQLLDIDFNLDLTGFETAEIDLIIESAEADEDDPAADVLPERDPKAMPVSRPGDLWHLGPHRLLCGDATSSEAFGHLLAGKMAQMVFTDPPYNLPIEGNVCGLGAIRHQNFAMASGEMTEAEFTDFLTAALTNLGDHSADGSIHFVCMDWRHMAELLAAARATYTELKNLCIWNKTNGGMGTFYRSKHELIFAYKNGTAPHINNFELGQHGRSRTNVWDYAGVNSLRAERLEELGMHPTVKPVALIADAIKDCSKRGGLILDSFAGSGSTIIAADKTGRRAFAMEIDPIYVDTAILRWQIYTGKIATLGETGENFSQVRKIRGQARCVDHDTEETAHV